ncbi:MAG TPA: fructose-6-phosphate aldolase [Acidobacteriota bacterium]|nr:fructose-6-phosphate aldolase [Acidobacteriota bacterium]
MKIFLDTANVDQIREAASWGILDGVTTNPSLAAKEGRSFDDVLKEIVALVKGPISAEVVADRADDMVEQGERLSEVASNIVIKIPMTPEGLKAIRMLREREIDTNCTLIFNATQGILAAKAGATFVSPFLGRLDDIGHDGMDLISQLVTVFDNYAFNTEVLAASIRHPLHVVEAALHGADVCTIPWKVLQQIVQHPLTDIGIDKFNSDWQKLAVSVGRG